MDHDEGICLDFMKEAIARFPEDDSYPVIFSQALYKLSQDLAKLTMNDDCKPYMDVSAAPCPARLMGTHTDNVPRF